MERFHQRSKKVIAARIVELALFTGAGVSIASCTDNIGENNSTARKSVMIAAGSLAGAFLLKQYYLKEGGETELRQDHPPQFPQEIEFQVSQNASSEELE